MRKGDEVECIDNILGFKVGLVYPIKEVGDTSITIDTGSEYVIVSRGTTKFKLYEEPKEKNNDFREFSKAIDEQLEKEIKDTDIVCPKCKVVNDFHQEDGLIKCESCGYELYTQDYYEKNRDVLKEECQFKKYGFEVPDFECEIFFKDKEGEIFGLVNNVTHFWDLEGNCHECNDVFDSREEFNLAPIKKTWYEEESNFPIAIIDDCDNIRVMYFEESLNFNIWRPATKEELLSLYKEVK